MDTTSNQLTAAPSWDVFLSFYGKDTRRNFTSHLYNALDEAGIKTFMDDPELEKGEEISSALLTAIRSSKMFVVVLSENYAYSSWCLDELVEILSCKRTKNQVVPVFYHVDPSDLRHQKGSFGVALESHKKRRSVDIIDKWRSALAQIAELSGYHLIKDANQSESEIVQEIAEYLAPQASTKVLHLEEYLFGIDSAVEEIYQKLRMESNDVRAIGICGMGGIGKTTIAKSFYNKYSNNFDISCFVENVKQDSEGSSLLPLLEKLLTDILRKKDYKVPNIVNGITQLKRILRFKKALIVVDDLDQSSYSELLVRLPNSFSAGSRIIITTRDANLLNQIKVDILQVEIYMVKNLDKIDSLEFFSYHAFNKTMPPERFRELSDGFVTYAGGLPLALKVLGSSLRGRTHMSFWNAKLEKVRKIPENEIQKILQLSYDELSDETQKTIFLDIVFFFVGKDKDEVVHIFESCDFFPEVGIPILVDRCLLIIDEDKKFQMHNLIQDMGREVIREENEHGKRRRLHLCQENAIHTLKNLEPPVNLKTINVSYSRNLKTTYDLRDMKLIEKLSLRGCESLVEVHPSIGQLSNLDHLDFSGCVNLKRLPDPIKQLTNLGHLNLYRCSHLKRLPEQLGDMKGLKKLNASYTAIEQLPDSIVHLKELVELELSNCWKLNKLPEQFGNMEGLRILDASWTAIEQLPDSIVLLKEVVELKLNSCEKLNKLPEQFGNMEGLKMINASYTAIEQLPDSIVQLKELVELELNDCEKLIKLPEQFGNMESLRTFNASYTAIEKLPDSLGQLKFLQVLYLSGCSKLGQLPEQLGKMQCLERLDASETAIEELPDSIGRLGNLEMLNLRECNKLKSVPNSMGNLASLTNLQLMQEGMVNLPDTVENMNLEYLSVRCNIRLCLPMILSFSCLRILDLTDEGHSFSSNEPFISLSKLSNLRGLTLRNLGGSSFPELPLNLETLSVVDMYAKLEQLPDLSSFKQLKFLYLTRCSSLQSLGPLPPHLHSLRLDECRSLQDVADLSMLKEMRELIFTRCSSLKLISLKESSLQIREMNSSFKVILPNREIPEWFNYKSIGRKISFHIPPILGDNFLGLAFWVVYGRKKSGDAKNLGCWHDSYIGCVITNKTAGIVINHHILASTTTDRVGEILSSVDCTIGAMHISVKSGDRIKVEFQKLLYSDEDGGGYVPTGTEVKMEMCGIHLIHKTTTPY